MTLKTHPESHAGPRLRGEQPGQVSSCSGGRAACEKMPPFDRSFARPAWLPDMFIYPLFVCTGEGQRREVGSMPGVYQLSVDEAVREAAAAKAEGIPGVLLFGLPETKDALARARTTPKRRSRLPCARSSARSRACSS